MSATFLEARPSDSDWIGWLKRELAPTHLREIRTAIMVVGTVLCVIISMALQVPELALSAYMIFYLSKETKALTTKTGVGGLVGVTIAVGITLELFKFTYGHPELRIPAIGITLFLGMWLLRVFVVGALGLILGFLLSYTQSILEQIPVASPELVVRASLWVWVAIAYAAGLTVVLNRLFLPEPEKAESPRPKPKSLFVPDAFTNPAHVRFALKVTFAAMFCYIFYTAIDWAGIHTAFITCIFIAQESTEATLYKGTLRTVGCVIGGALALFTIVFLMPHMETIASLVVVVACVAAIAGWVATGSERISYAGLQIAFAFFYSVFQGYAPDTDLDNVRNRVVGILFGLIVTGLVFQYIWPERTIDRLRDALRAALRQLAQLLEIPSPETSIETAKAETHSLTAETSKSFDQAKRYVELTRFEFEESPDRDRTSLQSLEETLSRAEDVFASVKSFVQGDAKENQSRTTLRSDIAAELQRLN